MLSFTRSQWDSFLDTLLLQLNSEYGKKGFDLFLEVLTQPTFPQEEIEWEERRTVSLSKEIFFSSVRMSMAMERDWRGDGFPVNQRRKG
jgi:hypothetical protein